MSALIHAQMNDRPILYSFRRCPYAMRARMAVAVSGIGVELREVVLRDKPPELLAASAKGTVPVLVLPDGHVIDESLDVMRWALKQNDPDDWLAGEDTALIATNDGPFKHALDRYKYPHRYALDDNTPFRNAGLAWLIELEQRLGNTPYLTGEQLRMTDIALMPFVRQFAATDRAWFEAQAIPQVQLWLTRLINQPLFEAIMRRYPQWHEGGAGVDFPD